jgi:tetratricopeptide (TPR) repeat protein
VLGAALALALGALGALLFSPALRTEGLWRPGSTERGLEARIAYAPADRYRPYVPERAGPGAPPPAQDGAPMSLRALASLEARGDLHGVAAAYLLRGEVRPAAAFLARSAPSVDRDCDRAVVALETGDLTRALALLDGVLRQAPEHPQALWNRALVLRALGRPLQAAEAFEAVVRKGEPGWSEEAGIRARALRRGGSWLN